MRVQPVFLWVTVSTQRTEPSDGGRGEAQNFGDQGAYGIQGLGGTLEI